MNETRCGRLGWVGVRRRSEVVRLMVDKRRIAEGWRPGRCCEVSWIGRSTSKGCRRGDGGWGVDGAR